MSLKRADWDQLDDEPKFDRLDIEIEQHNRTIRRLANEARTRLGIKPRDYTKEAPVWRR